MDAALLVREARRGAGLTQRQLAERVGTSQPAVARWERGRVAPTTRTLDDVLRACGYDVVLRTRVDPDHWWFVLNNRKLTPQQRLSKLTQMARFAKVGRQAMVEAKARERKQRRLRAR